MDFTEELNAFEQATIAAIEDCGGNIKGCAESAIFHLEQAFSLVGIDNEMAIFRAITAEEEAASSLFFCLKNNKYENADKIAFKNHLYKLGLNPCLEAATRKLGEIIQNDRFWFDDFKIRHSTINNRRCIELVFRLKDDGEYISPVPPLNFSIDSLKSGVDGRLSKTSLSNNIIDEFKTMALENQAKDVMKGLEEIAKQRNVLLYSVFHEFKKPVLPENLKPSIEDILRRQKKKTFRLLWLVLMIDPWEKLHGNSLFVQTVLNSYLVSLGKIQLEPYPDIE
jgi:hypothetical protein